MQKLNWFSQFSVNLKQKLTSEISPVNYRPWAPQNRQQCATTSSHVTFQHIWASKTNTSLTKILMISQFRRLSILRASQNKQILPVPMHTTPVGVMLVLENAQKVFDANPTNKTDCRLLHFWTLRSEKSLISKLYSRRLIKALGGAMTSFSPFDLTCAAYSIHHPGVIHCFL